MSAACGEPRCSAALHLTVPKESLGCHNTTATEVAVHRLPQTECRELPVNEIINTLKGFKVEEEYGFS